jgi:hypothetical protein
LSYATVKILTVKNLGFKVYKYKYVFETAKSNWGAGYKAQDAKNKKQEKGYTYSSAASLQFCYDHANCPLTY